MEPFKEPKRKYAKKDAGITWKLHLSSLFSDDAEKELDAKKKIANDIYEQERRDALEAYNKIAERFYHSQEQQHAEIDVRRRAFLGGDVFELIKYLEAALVGDSFTIDFIGGYRIKVLDLYYEKEKATLSLAYKIPTVEEMLLYSEFEYNSEYDEIVPKMLKKED